MRKRNRKDALAIHPQAAQRIREYLSAAEHTADLDGPMFRPLHNNGMRSNACRHMHPDAIDRVVRKFARRIGLDRGYFSHSTPRATFIATALDN